MFSRRGIQRDSIAICLMSIAAGLAIDQDPLEDRAGRVLFIVILANPSSVQGRCGGSGCRQPCKLLDRLPREISRCCRQLTSQSSTFSGSTPICWPLIGRARRVGGSRGSLMRTATPTNSFALIEMCEAISARIASLARMLSRTLRQASAIALAGFRNVRRSGCGDRHS